MSEPTDIIRVFKGYRVASKTDETVTVKWREIWISRGRNYQSYRGPWTPRQRTITRRQLVETYHRIPPLSKSAETGEMAACYAAIETIRAMNP